MTQTVDQPTAGDQWLTGSWMHTYSGHRFSFTHPSPDQVHIEDVAHHLAIINRYTGATREPYSVAQHSVLVAGVLEHAGHPPAIQFAGLMHDATEAYVNDLNRPAKYLCDDYRTLEDFLWTSAIAPRFGLPLVLPPEVKWADDVALFMERRDLLNPALYDEAAWVGEHRVAADLLDWPVTPWGHVLAEEAFLTAFEELSAAVKA